MKKIMVLLNFLILMFLCLSQAHAVWHREDVDTPRYFKYLHDRSLAISPDGIVHVAYGGDHLYHAFYDGNTWHYETVDPSTRTGEITSLAIGASGKIHILYTGEGYALKYASNVSGSWVIEPVNNMSSYDFSLAIDESDKAHISFRDYADSSIKYTTNASGSWLTELIDSDGYCISLALDSSNKAHISYSTDGVLKYATNSAGFWKVEAVDDSGYYVDSTSLAIDANDKVHISYSDPDLKYTTNLSGAWTIEVIDNSSVYYPSLVLDVNNKAHISYFDYSADDFKYATNASGNWLTVKVQHKNWWTCSASSLALAGGEKIRISYYDDYDFDLKYAWCDAECGNTSNWQVESIDRAGAVGCYNSLALDTNDKAHISYGDNLDTYKTNHYSALKYAANVSGSWMVETIDHGSYSGAGTYTSLALDPNDKAHISNLGAYFTNVTGSWVKETPGIGMFTSLALDADNSVHISYYDDSGRDLKYTTNATGSWITEMVDSLGDVGEHSSLAIDSYGKVHISYVAIPEEGRNTLKYATNRSGSWETETIVEGLLPSLALDKNDRAHISFYDAYASAIKYATNASGAWVIQTVDNAPWAYNSLALDSRGKVHISYFGLSDKHPYGLPYYNLKYATNAFGAWMTEIIDGSGCAGGFTSIALDSHDKVHISYDDCNYDLKYVRQCPAMDVDCDEIANWRDNCPNDYNPDQTDRDGDGQGDVCDAAVSTSTVSATTTTTVFTTTSVSFSTTSVNPATSTTTTSSFCPCIAVSLYGEDSPETERMRHFRDSILRGTEEGMALINLYYQWSPAIVKAIEEDEEFKKQVKAMMDLALQMIKEDLN